MIIDWRSRRYRGGSGWVQAGVVVALVGVTSVIVQPARDTIDVAGSYIPENAVQGAYEPHLDASGEYLPVFTSTGTFGVNIMAIEATLGGKGKMFIGEDKTLRLTGVVDENGALIDFSTWTIRFVAGPFNKLATVSGTFNSNPALNAQVATVQLSAAETAALVARAYPYSWKRVDSGFSEVLAYGDWPVQRATQ